MCRICVKSKSERKPDSNGLSPDMTPSPGNLPTTEMLVAFLSSPKAYGADVHAVQVIETHGAFVFLTPSFAYKMKKPVDLGYLDFSTLDKRRQDSEREVALNRRSAPMIYRRAIPVTRDKDSLSLDGEGEAVEWLVEMVRFDETQVLDHVLDDAPDGFVFSDTLMRQIAVEIAQLHTGAEQRTDKGGPDAIRVTFDSNFDHLSRYENDIATSDQLAAFRDKTMACFASCADLLQTRKEAGYVRHCHGDLHLGNIVLIDELPVLFDCIEFSEDLACIDILYDLAFLLMDLSQRGLKQNANQVLNAYLLALPFEDALATARGLQALPLFLSCRAAVRSHVTALTAQSARLDAGEKTLLLDRARAYFDFSTQLLEPPSPRLIAVGGLSGTGKSTLAKALAPHVPEASGAVLLRTDELRKALFDVGPLHRLPDSAYTRQVTETVYQRQRELAEAALLGGYSVIVDGVFAHAEEREAVEGVASLAGVPFQGFWLAADRQVLLSRVEARRNDASDAKSEVVRAQFTYDLGQMTWTQIDANGPPETSLSFALNHLCI